MMWQQHLLEVATRGRGTYEVTDRLQAAVRGAGVRIGLCHVFIQHTSASLIVSENADPTVRGDLERFMSALVVDGDAKFQHRAEGPDDMAAHVRSVLTASELTLPISAGRLALGTWQGAYVWEHRQGPQSRRLTVTLQGDSEA